MNKKNRREILTLAGQGVGLLSVVSLLGGLSSCSGSAKPLPMQILKPGITLVTGTPGNSLLVETIAGLAMVDTAAAERGAALLATLAGSPVNTLFNTHYHRDQTGANALIGETGAQICAQEITRQWTASDYYIPAEERWEHALPIISQPTRTFRVRDELVVGDQNIICGYLLEAHTRGDMYVYFSEANVLAVGDVASPERDPVLDWFAGGWLGGRVDAIDDLLEIANNETLIVPAYGSVMTRGQLQTERDMMQYLFDRTTDMVDHGFSAQDMLESGVMDEVVQKFNRRFNDNYRFLYDVAKSHWAHYTNFGGNIV
jgi:cyclase